MIYFKANGTEHPASIDGKLVDRDWGGRESKAVTLETTYAAAVQLFLNGLNRYIVERGTVKVYEKTKTMQRGGGGRRGGIVERGTVPVYDESGQPTGETQESVQEWDNSDYCVAGPITDNRDGTCTCKLGKKTETELLREVSADAEQAAKILLGEAE